MTVCADLDRTIQILLLMYLGCESPSSARSCMLEILRAEFEPDLAYRPLLPAALPL